MTAPKAPRELSAWLDGRRIATLRSLAGWRIRLKYAAEVADTMPGGILLSLSMPVQPRPYADDLAGTWADNLLPEGPPRSVLARALRVRPFDTFGILAEIGRDCAGAVTFLPADETPTQHRGTYRELTAEEFGGLISNLASHPLGVDIEGKTRLSLAGVQEKLLLTKLPTGAWAQPVDGAPSTHIVKPEPPLYPGMAIAEYFGLEWARAAGLTASEVELLDVDGRPVLAVRRYDREVTADGTVRRLHQEDSCQALGLRSDRKYESQGGPSFRAVARLLLAHSWQPMSELAQLLRIVVMTAAVGNADAHGKNLSFFLDSGVARLTPLYDVIPTMSWPGLDTDAGMYLNGKPDIRDWVRADLVEEGTRWGLPARVATPVVTTMIDALAAAFAPVADRVGLPAEIRQGVVGQLERLTQR